ncbi:MAG: exodeoxyribonuclease III [Methyloligellaceae bacterium]
MQFRLITWNINSVRRRIDLLKELTEQYQPDVVCLQEIKCLEDQFPLKAVRAMGYDFVEIHGQKAYHGVATLSKLPISALERVDFNGTEEARHLSVAVDIEGFDSELVVHNFYVPAGGDIPDIDANPKFAHKLNYLNGMTEYFSDLSAKSENHMVLVGDLNVAPLEQDVWSHRQMLKVVSHTPIEVEHFDRVQNSHEWVDIMRQHVPEEEKLYTWWSYRSRDWRASNRGRRLDHVWVTPSLSQTATRMIVGDEVRGWDAASDHAPVIVDFDLN